MVMTSLEVDCIGGGMARGGAKNVGDVRCHAKGFYIIVVSSGVCKGVDAVLQNGLVIAQKFK